MEQVINVQTAVIAAVALVLGLFIGYVVRKMRAEGKVKSAEALVTKMISDANSDIERKQKEAKLEARDELYRIRLEFDNETKERRQELLNIEKRLTLKEENLERKVDVLDKKERETLKKESECETQKKVADDKVKEYAALIEKERDELQKISRLSVEDAKRMFFKKIEDEVKYEASVIIKKTEDELRENSERMAREILSTAIQKCAVDHTQESTVSVVSLPSDEMKGRIIGREGRNIRVLEMETGCDLIIDDTPEAVIISGFDPIRREVAKMTLEKLIADGRIHPARIEEVCNKMKKEMQSNLKELGEAAVLKTGIIGVHSEIIKLLGRLRYRTSYGQNVLQHSLETALLMGNMAGELEIDVKLAKRIGLLHDIGKAVDHEVEGSHANIGADLAKKYGEHMGVVHAIRAHHRDEEQKTIYAVLVEAADAISASRSGARGETVETYIQRLEKLEEVANSFKGVEKSYVIQAGREIRCVVEPQKLNDLETVTLARDLSKKIESELDYPGQIKVTVIRETRAVEYAK
ncbi:MAG: ribonuclease Y [Candidatus Omnitrophica bacterium]|nr:ribonuclease Y [Candidatus Omnitrophota bacterium]